MRGGIDEGVDKWSTRVLEEMRRGGENDTAVVGLLLLLPHFLQ